MHVFALFSVFPHTMHLTNHFIRSSFKFWAYKFCIVIPPSAKHGVEWGKEPEKNSLPKGIYAIRRDEQGKSIFPIARLVLYLPWNDEKNGRKKRSEENAKKWVTEEEGLMLRGMKSKMQAKDNKQQLSSGNDVMNISYDLSLAAISKLGSLEWERRSKEFACKQRKNC